MTYICDKDNDIFNNKKYLLFHNDFKDLKCSLKDTVNLIVTSPPYSINVKYNSFNDNIDNKQYYELIKDFFNFAYSVLKEDGRICLNMPIKNSLKNRWDIVNVPIIAKKYGFELKHIIFWEKSNIKKHTTWGSWLSPSAPNLNYTKEAIYVFYKSSNGWKLTHGNKEKTISKNDFISWNLGDWVFNGETNKNIINNHPAPFPIELPYRCINLFSYPNDVILDCFGGIGTTTIASLMSDRRSIYIEIDEEYFNFTKKRINDFIINLQNLKDETNN